MKIVFLCPPVGVVNGGIKQIFRMAEALIAQGRDAVVFEQNGRRPDYFPTTAPVIGQGLFSATADHVYVLPEDQPQILSDFSRLPQRKVIYSQNHFYGALGLGAADSYADYGVSDIICSSQTIFDHARMRHPLLRAHLVPCAIDRSVFRDDRSKLNTIAFMPRKRPIEAVYIRDMFRFLHTEHKSWSWAEISGVDEAAVASTLGGAKVFLSLSRLEGFGLAPLEAMASGCVVAGFTGGGGREYATTENGFWAAEDDFPACVEALAAAVHLCEKDVARQQDYRDACGKALASYTPDAFANAVKLAWSTILPG